ncbi:50S ribosomal protein L1 [Candidatus Woesearchaeota archaeon]|nr:50S ribosomal protein L1 [Candidatus Woesearchaeota archaeon]MCF7900875.1 50S ribosomal protein L1 [Candidatus Woesearchaeota archaeon]MCF8013890.1 50S ribosomal protein L1 [Candidatus Woesearchaeota archaeon]
MDKETTQKIISELRENSKKRKFSQSFDLIVTLKDLNLKNPEEQVEFYTELPHALGKKVKVAALVGPELKERAEGIVDTIIAQDDFAEFKDKKLAKKLAKDHDFFIAQAEIMPKVAAAFGRVLGPRNKMPNPKLGSILPAKGSVEPLYKKLQKTVRISGKKAPMLQVKVGTEDMKDEDIIENITTAYNQIEHHLPKEKGNVKYVLLKLTMSKPIKIE